MSKQDEKGSTENSGFVNSITNQCANNLNASDKINDINLILYILALNSRKLVKVKKLS